ncbi:MAG TPA: glycosyltransferase [Acidimicrobiales bacterium]|nr:glycosyltransferase [Acidimicrobiales bacterium]
MSGAPDRVLHYIARWLPASEGFVHDLVENVRRGGLVVSMARPENTERFPLRGGVRLVSLATVRAVTPPPLRQKAVTASLLTLARRHRVGVVHAHHGYRADNLAGLLRHRSMPLVLSLHGDDVTGHVAAQPDYYRHIVDRVGAVIVPSRFLAGLAESQGFAAERIRVIPSGVDTSYFTPSPVPLEHPEVVFVGRFVEKKGLDVLAAAWPTVREAVPTARLRLLGFGPLEPLARSIGGDVEVVLSPTRPAVRDAMRGARVVVSPSRMARGDAVESLVVVNLEAQASARPVVTTRHGGIPEFVSDGETALVVPENDPGELVRALVTVLTDDDLARRLGGAGPAWAAAFDLRRTARQVDDLYDELLAADLNASATRRGHGRGAALGR